MDGRMDGWMKEWMDERVICSSIQFIFLYKKFFLFFQIQTSVTPQNSCVIPMLSVSIPTVRTIAPVSVAFLVMVRLAKVSTIIHPKDNNNNNSSNNNNNNNFIYFKLFVTKINSYTIYISSKHIFLEISSKVRAFYILFKTITSSL